MQDLQNIKIVWRVQLETAGHLRRLCRRGDLAEERIEQYGRRQIKLILEKSISK
jgi:hypothetical protein